MPKKIQFTVEPIVSVQTGQKITHSFDTFILYISTSEQDKIKEKWVTADFMCVWFAPGCTETAGVNRMHITAKTINYLYIVNVWNWLL